MSLTIKHPKPTQGTVEVSGLTFVDGVAEISALDDAARAVLTDHGFTFDGENDVPESPEDEAARLAAETAEAQRLADEKAADDGKAEADRQAAENAEKTSAKSASTK